MHAASSNDFADRNIDAINLKGSKDRLLITNSITVRQLWIVHIVSGLTALAVSSIFGYKAVVLMFMVLLLDYAYSFRPFVFSHRGMLAQLVLPIAYVILPFSLGFWSAQVSNPYPYLLVAGLYIGFIARLFLKDFRDVVGDKKFGKRTFVVRHGRQATSFASGITSVLSFIIICFAVELSIGTVVILCINQLWTLQLLNWLRLQISVDAEKKIIRTLAKIGNGSVVAILIFAISGELAQEYPYLPQLLPLLVGLLWLSLVAKSAGLVFKFNSAGILQHFAWLPLRIFGYMFCSLKIKGAENVRSVKGNVIFASNHSSELDPLIIVASLPYFSHLLPISYVARSKVFYASLPNGFMYGGKFFALMGAYPAYTGLKDYNKSLPHHIEAIKKGWSIGIFPVGKKHKIDDVKNARGGVIFLSHKANLPIIPVRIDGLENRTVNDYLKRRTKIVVSFGKPVYSEQFIGKKIDRRKVLDHKTSEFASVKLMDHVAKL